MGTTWFFGPKVGDAFEFGAGGGFGYKDEDTFIGDTVYISSWFRDSDDAGTWSNIGWTAKVRNHQLRNDTHADQDAVSYKDYLPAGTYTLKVLSDTNNNRGILKVKIDGVVVATFDCYSGSLIHNVVYTQANISVATSGVKTIQCIVDGKNGSSSDYWMVLSEMVFYRTA